VNDSYSDDVTQHTDPVVMRAQVRVGQVLKEKWRLDVLLGVGGMAAVYAATHRNGSRVAIKLLHPELSTHHQVRTRFLREGYVANTVGHEGAVRIMDDDIAEDGSAFFVMELLDGETLEARRVRCGGQLSEDEVLWLADQLLDVLAAAHGKGVVHRDIKPDNVFVTRAGQVKVLDFGIARLREATSKSTATASGATMGTPAFMSPEQARGFWDEVDGRSDLWAVGATMFNLLTGRVAHEGRTANEQLLHAMTAEPEPLESVLPGATPAVCHVINRAVSFEKALRWSDAQRMQEAVRHAYSERFGKPITTSPRLVVPESVPNRTLANLPIPLDPVATRLPTTGQAVARSRDATTVPARLSRNALIAVLFAGVAVLGITVITTVWLVSAVHKGAATATTAVSARGEASITPTPAAAFSALPLAASSTLPSTPSAPAIAVTDLPTAAPPSPQPAVQAPMPRPAFTAAPQIAVSPPAATFTARAVASSAVPATAPQNCNPPYTIDRATGKKHFKAACL